ncbi:HlyD family type I secretion periplasmic adaptor subunit [Hyphococcus sp.]|uniref:HlyD family type I secretion periplasmic adaptor subunit n=1 Tax=Hyphococcus sp. TaxID=2038636 RepID=UPI003D14A98B
MTKPNMQAVAKHEKVGERHGLSLPLELEEGAPPHLAKSAMAVVSGLFIFLLVWANIAHVRELSVATGEIAPYGSTREAAHYEGGIIEELLVKPGDSVSEGQPLAKLRAESGGGEFDRLGARRASLEIRAERMAAQMERREADFSLWRDTWLNLVTEQEAVFEAASAQHRAAMETFISREASAQAEVIKAEAELKTETDLLQYAREQLAIQDELIDEGFTSKQTYLQAKSNVASAKMTVVVAQTRLDQARDALNAASAERAGAEAEYKSRIAEERASILSELAEIEQPFMSSRDRSDRLTVRAPVAGVVNEIFINGAGDVVRPGGVIAEITPTGAEFFAEVRINPKDIGHISPGQTTDISVTTFDPNRYGKLTGQVSHISADSFTDERTGEAYYIASIALDEQKIGKGAYSHTLTPGMQVRAEIVTQSRTLMQYILKPVNRSLDRAFTER